MTHTKRTDGVQMTTRAWAVAGLLALASPALAARVPGGGSPRTDCYAEFEVTGAGAGVTGPVQCADGDPSCDADGVCNDSCRVQVALCANQHDLEPTCTPPPALYALAPRGAAKRLGLQSPPLDGSACGAFLDVDVPVRVRNGGRTKRPGRLTLAATAVASTRPKRDRDLLRLECLPCRPTPAVAACPAGLAGAPNELRLTVAASGTDLDNGWSGMSHNFPLVAASTLHYCLSGCDASSDPICQATGTTGPGSVNGTTFGPPLPLLAAGVPVCTVNRYRDPAMHGVADVSTGAIDATLNLLSDVYITSQLAICPRCTGRALGDGGVCDSGADEGRACVVEGIVPAGDQTYRLSSACRPPGSPSGTLELALPLTTATSTMAGSKPCTEESGVTMPDNACPAGTGCGSTCTGAACATRTADGRCVDQKGGLSQVCCDADTTRPCFPTAAGDLGRIERVGAAAVPTPAWPAGSYPKTGDETLVATFCEPPTMTTMLNGLAGLPGPGAVVMPVAACWGAPGGECR